MLTLDVKYDEKQRGTRLEMSKVKNASLSYLTLSLIGSPLNSRSVFPLYYRLETARRRNC
jgi:hypothetical protein